MFCYLYFNFSLIRDDSVEESIDNFAQKIDESAEGMVDFINNCPLLYGTAKEMSFVHDSSLVTSRHTEATIHDINHFFTTLHVCPNTKHLAEMVPDPRFTKKTVLIRKFFVWVRGLRDVKKWKIINHCSLIFGKSLLKKEYVNRSWMSLTPNEKADATYQPNTVLTIHKRINSVFCQEGIQYSLHSDFEGTGGFRAFWKKRFEEALKYRSDIGSVPF